MTNLNRQPIGPFAAPSRGWDGQEPELPSLPDTLMEDDPGIYQDLLAERDEAMQRYEQVRTENQRLRSALEKHHRGFVDTPEHKCGVCREPLGSAKA